MPDQPAPRPHMLRTAAAAAAVMAAAAVVVAVHISPWALLAWPLCALLMLAAVPAGARHRPPNIPPLQEDHQVPDQPYDVELDLTDDDHLAAETETVWEADQIGPPPSQDPSARFPDTGVAQAGP